jgi:polysaccharide biosynthesis/export protein
MMSNKSIRFLYFFVLSFITIQISYAQVIDPKTLIELDPQKIEELKNTYQSTNSSIDSLNQLEIHSESLEENRTIKDSNNISGKKFGYDFFSSMPTSLIATGDLPFPNEYKISLKDRLSIILSGSIDKSFLLDVKLDGTILFPEIGSVSVIGLSFEEVKKKLSDIIKLSYIGVDIDVSLQNLSAKKITIVGAVKTPGTYLVNPFSTITSVLAYSGGISEIGSLRDIKLIRNNKEVFSFDLYDLLIKGDRSKDLTIEAGDTILINSASQFIEIKGAVNRPAIYEILEGETLEDIVDFALGFEQTANQSNISMSFIDLNESKIFKRNTNNIKQDLKNVLTINVFNYVNEEVSNIGVFGAIEEPGYYDIQKFKTLEDLLNNLKFVDVYPWLAVLEQFDKNELIRSSVLFNLNDPNTYKSIQLFPNSKVYFANLNTRSFDVSNETQKIISEYSLTLNYKQESFEFPVYGNYSVNSFVNLLGIDMSDVNNVATYLSPLEDIIINEDYKKMQFVAKKYNTVSFRSPSNNLIYVNVVGAVDYEGRYVLNNNSTLEDLYQLIGNFKTHADKQAISLTRENIRTQQINAIKKSKEELEILTLSSSLKGGNIINQTLFSSDTLLTDTTNLGRLSGDFSPKSLNSINTILNDGDEIIVPVKSNNINVFGAVLNPITFQYSKKININSAIKLAGGYLDIADKRKIYVIKKNGLIKKGGRTFLFFRKNILLEPGDSIVVPIKITANSQLIEEIIPITQILSDLSFSAAALESLKI